MFLLDSEGLTEFATLAFIEVADYSVSLSMIGLWTKK
jgi:hypothetical protein